MHSPGSYIWPPRPETVIPSCGISVYEERGWWGQPKLNGSCCELITDGASLKVMNRHKEAFSSVKLDRTELLSLHRYSGFTILVGEYMNKSQKGSNGKVWNAKFVIFDILMLDGKHLKGFDFETRQEMLDMIYPEKDTDHSEVEFLKKISENVYRCRNFEKNLISTWEKLVKVEMYEGMVLKNPKGLLDYGFRQVNNTEWQAKCRKPTKNYSY
jgi:hypothetical protein